MQKLSLRRKVVDPSHALGEAGVGACEVHRLFAGSQLDLLAITKLGFATLTWRAFMRRAWRRVEQRDAMHDAPARSRDNDTVFGKRHL